MEFSIGTIIGNKYLNTEERWYIIVKECAKTVFAKRLKVKKGPKDKFGNTIMLPTKNSYGNKIRFKKDKHYVKSFLEGPLLIYNGDYEDWENRLNCYRQCGLKTI